MIRVVPSEDLVHQRSHIPKRRSVPQRVFERAFLGFISLERQILWGMR